MIYISITQHRADDGRVEVFQYRSSDTFNDVALAMKQWCKDNGYHTLNSNLLRGFFAFRAVHADGAHWAVVIKEVDMVRESIPLFDTFLRSGIN